MCGVRHSLCNLKALICWCERVKEARDNERPLLHRRKAVKDGVCVQLLEQPQEVLKMLLVLGDGSKIIC